MRARQFILHAVDHRLHEGHRETGHAGEALVHFGDQLLLAHARLPAFVRMQAHAGFDVRRCPVIGAIVVAPRLRDDGRHFRKFQRGAAQFAGHFGRLVQGDPGRHLHLQPQRTFIEVGQEVAADAGAQDGKRSERSCAHHRHPAFPAHHALEEAAIRGGEFFQHAVMRHAARLAEGQPGQARYQHQRHHQRAHQRRAHRIRHRRKQLVFDALEGEQGQVGGDDDGHAEHDGVRHLQGGADGVLQGERPFLLAFTAAQYVFQHHHGTVDKDAEVDRAQGQQVGGNLEMVHEDEGDQQGQRNRQRDDGGRARAAQEQQQHQGDEQHAFAQGITDRVQGGVDQRTAVQIGHDLHILRQHVGIQIVHGRMDARQRCGRVEILQQQGDAFDGVGIVVLAEDAAPLDVAVRELAQVLHQHGHAVLAADDDVAHVVEGMQQADAAHHVRLLAAVDHAAAAADVVGVDGILDLCQREAVAVEFCGIEFQHELCRQAAEIAHVRHAAHLLQAGDHGPELQLGQFA
ncbi:hypothetical protein D3C81_215420 [compost metagenome]